MQKPKLKAQEPKRPKKSARNKFRLSGKVKKVAIDSITPNSHNARTHSKKQIGQIADSIRKFGFTNPIIVDEKSIIIAGHGRHSAAKLLELTKVPVIRVSHLSQFEKRALMLADNKIAENAGWDVEILAAELEGLSIALPELDFDLELTGFSTGEIDVLFGDHEVRSAEPAEIIKPVDDLPPISLRGYLWRLGKHLLLCGDSRNQAAVVYMFRDEFATMVVTDPPYNVKVKGHVGGRGKIKHEEFAFASGEMSDEEYQLFLNQTLGNTAGVCISGGLIYSFIDWRHIEVVLTCGRNLGLILKNICVWNKTTPGQGSFYRSAHELVVVFQKPGDKAINNVELGKYGRNRTNVWSYPGVNTFMTGNSDELTLHPTVKPIAMIAEAIKDASRRNDIVFDPFIGSGTTILAAEKVGRRCYGIEYEPKYVDTAIRRWQELTGKDAVLIADNIGQDNDAVETSLQSAELSECATVPTLINQTFGEVEQYRRSQDAAVPTLNVTPRGDAL